MLVLKSIYSLSCTCSWTQAKDQAVNLHQWCVNCTAIDRSINREVLLISSWNNEYDLASTLISGCFWGILGGKLDISIFNRTEAFLRFLNTKMYSFQSSTESKGRSDLRPPKSKTFKDFATKKSSHFIFPFNHFTLRYHRSCNQSYSNTSVTTCQNEVRKHILLELCFTLNIINSSTD